MIRKKKINLFPRIIYLFAKKNASLTFAKFLLFRLTVAIFRILGKYVDFDFNRFWSVNSLPFTDLETNQGPKEEFAESIDLTFVATLKDLEVLKVALPSAQKSLGYFYSNKTRLIVPGKMLKVFLRELGSHGMENVELIAEEDLCPAQSRNKLVSCFGTRSGWILQQFLKLQSVQTSESNYTLVVDADTVLLCGRDWINSEGKLLIMPSWEYHEGYYLLLEQIQILSERPKYSFITHHMLYKKEFLMNAVNHAGFGSTLELFDYAIDQSSLTPLQMSLDYEFYSQYVYNFRSAEIRLEKWSNHSISPEIFRMHAADLSSKFGDYASVSAHNYN